MAMNFHHSPGRFQPAGYSNMTGSRGKKEPVDVTSWSSCEVSPAIGPPLFYVGAVSLRGLDPLLAALGKARISTGIIQPDAYAFRTNDYTFLGWENIDQGKPATRIFAAPRSNEWKFTDRELQRAIKSYEHDHPLICSFIEGWLSANIDEHGHLHRCR